MNDMQLATYRGFSKVSREMNLSILPGSYCTGLYLLLVCMVEAQGFLGNFRTLLSITKPIYHYTENPVGYMSHEILSIVKSGIVFFTIPPAPPLSILPDIGCSDGRRAAVHGLI